MKTAEIISKLNTEFGWNTKNDCGFSPTQEMIIQDTIKAVILEVIGKIDKRIYQQEQSMKKAHHIKAKNKIEALAELKRYLLEDK